MPLPIKRIVVLMMENHSFDRMLGWMTQKYPTIAGVDPAHPRSNPNPTDGTPIAQAESRNLEIASDPGHDVANVLRQLAGGNQGFVADLVAQVHNPPVSELREVMAWYPYGLVPALHFLAYNFVVCDHWFASVPGPTWPNRFFAHSGTSLGHVDMPEAGNVGLHDYNQRTLYDELSDAGVDWRIYHGDFPQSLVMTHQWKYPGHYRPFDRFVADAQSGDLPPYVFIEPTYMGAGENDQHPPQNILMGDNLIGNVFNALHANPVVFDATLLAVLYDEHGGFYDHVEPPATVAPDVHTAANFDFKRLGVRVPAVLVSPWLDPGFVSTVFDHTSLLKMATQLWPGVRPLGLRAAQANSPLDELTWRTTARTAIPPAPLRPDIQTMAELPALNGQAQSLVDFSQHLQEAISDPAKRAELAAQSAASFGTFAQGQLAVDRLNAFLDERRAQQISLAAPSSSNG